MRISHLLYSNERPFDPVVGEAATQIGLIYLVIIAFFSVLLYSPIHPQIAGNIHMGQYYAYRLLLPFIAYFFLSLIYTVLSVIWGIDFNNVYGHAGTWLLSVRLTQVSYFTGCYPGCQ